MVVQIAAAEYCLNITAPTRLLNSVKFNELKSMSEIQPKVTEDLIAIVDKFRCHDKMAEFLNTFVSIESIYSFIRKIHRYSTFSLPLDV